jgi:hypothetical protein
LNPEEDKLLPNKVVAERYNTRTRTIERWREQPELGFPPGIDINGRIYRKLSDLIAWEKQRATTHIKQRRPARATASAPTDAA